MDKRILTVALAALLAACGGGDAAEGEVAQDSVPAGATIEGVAPAAEQPAPMAADSAANMGAPGMAPAGDSMAGMSPPAMGTDSAATQ